MIRFSSTFLDELHGLLLTKELSMSRRKKIAHSSAHEPFHAISVQSQAPILPTPPPQVFSAHNNQPLQSSFRYNSNRGKNNRDYNSNRANRGNHGNNSWGNYQNIRNSSFSGTKVLSNLWLHKLKL